MCSYWWPQNLQVLAMSGLVSPRLKEPHVDCIAMAGTSRRRLYKDMQLLEN